MSHHHKHHATVTEPTGDANPDNHQVTNSSSELRSASDVDARISESPAVTSTEQFRVRVSSEGEAHVSARGTEAEKLCGSDGKSRLTDSDDCVGSERNGGVSKGLRHGLEVGDLVWGKVKSHPWWPGHIYNEAFVSSSVRRTKKEGLVLVAFFGDSSYGWFEPSQLIPFDANFAEKSKQTNSRSFAKAVEEAVDEASRRCALGLICRCRSPDNFRPTSFQGYFSVQVPDYEPGIYSEAQIRKARYGFGPTQTLAFIKQLAVAPHGGDHRSFSFAKNKATVFALRRAVFEPNDETYAQAFGAQPLRPSDSQARPLDQPLSQPTGARLSGPLVVAEILDGENNTSKFVKAKDNLMKDKYLFKRQDEASNSFQLASREEETPDAGQHYVSQKRPVAVSVVAPQVLEKHEDTGFINQYGAASAINAKVAVDKWVQPDGSGLASQEITLDAKHHHLDKGKESSEEITKSFEPIDIASKNRHRSVVLALPSQIDETSQSTHLESKTSTNVEHDGNVILSGPDEDFQQTEQGFLTITDEAKHHKLSVHGVLKKINVQKRPADDSNSEASAVGGKKKKRKETLNLQPTSGHLEKLSTSEKSVRLSGKLIGKTVSTGLAPREDLHSEPVEMDISASNLLPVCNIAEVNFKLPQLFYELQALALDPFHGVRRGIPAVVRQFFLHFRSLVYQKSLFLSPPIENGAPEIRATKSPSSFGAYDSPNDHTSASPLVKPVKHIVQPDDPTKAGRKRALSDRQEEITAKRLKKIKDLKALAAGKKAASQKTSEAQQGEGEEPVVQAPGKIVKPASQKTSEAQQGEGKESMVQAPRQVVKPASQITSEAQQGEGEEPAVQAPRRIVKPASQKTSEARQGEGKESMVQAPRQAVKPASQKTSEAQQGEGEEPAVQAPRKIVKPASQKTSEAQQGEGKESVVQAPRKIVKPDSTRKVVRPAKPVEPTMLTINFPPKTSLPSVAELKARFARFGPIDQSGLRVFWKSLTCRVVFLHKVDAQAAYKFAVANQSLFGCVGVRYYLREAGDSSSEASEAAKARGDDGANETPRIKDPAVVERQTSESAQQPLPQPMIQIKSILKKSTGDESGQGTGNGGSSRGTPRVKFMLGGEESSRGELLVVGNRNNFNNASFADGSAPSRVAVDFNSTNVEKVISQPSLPNLPFPTQFTKIPQHNLHNSELAPRNTPNFINTTASAIPTTVDISPQMILLLTRCHDVVTNLTGLLGYVPYHPL